MKGKKKLVSDSDNQSVSPSTLLEGVADTSKSISSEPKLGKKKFARTYNYDPVENYLISVLEPSENPTSINQIEAPKSQSNNKRTSLNRIQHQTLSSKGNVVQEQRDIQKQITNLKRQDKSNNRSCKLLFQNNNILQGIVRSQKISNLKKNFIKKIRRSSTCYEPVALDRLDNSEKEGFLYMKGIEIIPIFQSVFNLLSVLQITSLLVIYSVSFVFEDLLSGQYPIVDMIQIFSLVFYWTEIILNFISIKFSAGKKIEIFKDIVNYYISQTFWVDFVSAVILLLDIISNQDITSYFRMFIIMKLPQCLDKIQKIEVYFIRNVYNEQYWEMIKVFLVNFCYAHVITLVLAAMANFNPSNNWLTVKGIASAPWLQRYVWSYYWATNIMLTVGFGDLMAANYLQAICVIFVETFSCIIMAYNINRVGSIISNIRQQDMNRSKKFKIFRKLTDQNTVSQELAFKINNYIEESSKLQKKFNYEEDQEFLKELPQNLRVTYLKEANKQILNKLVFFKSLLDRTLCNFSEQLQTKISHPQEIIRSLDDDFNLIILKKGHIGYICKKNGCNFNDNIVDEIKVNSKESPFLTSLDFISKIRPQYEIKSLQFSVLFTLNYSAFIQIFRKSDMDYELFCFLRDKCRNIPDQFQVMPCEFCKNYNHFKFTCPRLHYAPYEQHVIDKEIYKEQTGLNNRKFIYRDKPKSFKPMEYYKKVKGYREDMVRGRSRANIAREQQSSYVFPDLTMKNINSFQTDEPVSMDRIRSGTTMEQMVYEKAREVIEIELLKKERQQNFNDDVWILNLDVMANYNSYFPQDNPKSVEEKFSKEARMASKKLRFNHKMRGSISQAQDNIELMVEEYKLMNLTGNLGVDEDHVEELD